MKKSLWVICVLLVVILAGLMFTEQKTKNEKTTQIESVNQNSAYYEEELSDLKAELEEKRAALEVVDEIGSVCIAAKVSSADELATLNSWFEEYNYPLTVIIDASSASTISPILSSIKTNSIMYCGSSYDWVENTEDADSILSRNNLSQCGIAYFDYAASYSQIAAAEEAGMRGYSNPITSSEDFDTQMKDGEISSIDHLLLTNSANVSDVAQIAANERKIFILAIDMANLNKSFSENSARQALETIDS